MTELRNLHQESVAVLDRFKTACEKEGMNAAYGDGFDARNNLIGKLFVPGITNLWDRVKIEPGEYPEDGVAFMITNGRRIELPRAIVTPTDKQRTLAMKLAKEALGGIFNELGIQDDIYESWRPPESLRYEGTNSEQALAKCLTFEHRVMTQDGKSDESVTVFTRPVIIGSNRLSIRNYPSYQLGVVWHEVDHAIRRLLEPAVLSSRFEKESWVLEDERLAENAQAKFQAALKLTDQYENISPKPESL